MQIIPVYTMQHSQKLIIFFFSINKGNVLYAGDEGNWMWAHSHEFLTESFWGDNRPNNRTGNSDDCVVMILRSNVIWWEDRSCLVHDISQHAVAPICQHDSTEASTTQTPETTTTAFQCPSNWAEFEGHCYILKSTSYSWNNAENDCATYGAHLTSIHSKAEDDFVYSLSTSDFYIGAYYGGGFWRWSDGSAWNYTNWYSHSDSECAYYDYGYGWRNTNCGNSNYYMCKL
jgi:regenerating islet-derived protein 4